jgi:Glycosyl hydrolases family 15
VAAPTTSLPEQLGGVRNWDYRYSWLRDAAMDLYALFTLGYTDEAHAFMGWLERTTSGRAEDLQLMYGVGGERLLPEIQLDTLDGYRGSRPVRIGNAAADQFQLDVYGYLLDTAWLYHRHGGPTTPTFWRLLAGAVDVVARRWTEPDDGIWEVRGGRRHFVASKVMAWVAVDRAIRWPAAWACPPTWTAGRRWRAPSAARSSRPGSTRPAARSPRPSAAGLQTPPTSCCRWSASSHPTTRASAPPWSAPPASWPPRGSSTATSGPTTGFQAARRAS